MTELVFRPCTEADADTAVPLIYDSGPIAFRWVFSQSHEMQALEFLRMAFVDGDGQFGYRKHTAVERDGRMLAVAALWDSRSNLANTAVAVRQILGFYGVRGFAVMLRGLRLERVVRPARRGVGYIGHVAVLPELRGQGIGRALMHHLLERARTAGYPRAALDVASSNLSARALYEGLGFQVVATRYSKLVGRWGTVVDHHYMELPLEPEIDAQANRCATDQIDQSGPLPALSEQHLDGEKHR